MWDVARARLTTVPWSGHCPANMAAVEESLSPDAKLTEAIEMEQWEDIATLLRRAKCSHQLRQWAIEKVVEAADEEANVCEVIGFCVRDQVSPLFSLLIKRGLWEAVDRLVSSWKCDDELRHRVVEEAVKHGDDDDRIGRILISHCASDQVDTALSHLIRRGRWGSVRDLINSRKCTFEQQHWALEELVKHAPDDTVCDVIYLHATDQTDTVWSHLIRRDLGNAVYRLVEWFRCGDEQRCKAVEVAAKHADKDRLGGIIDHCSADQADSVWSHVIRRGLWDTVHRLMDNSKCSNDQRRMVIEEAIQHAGDKHMSRMIRHCATDQVDTVLPRLIRKSLWRAVDKLMKSSKCSEKQRREAAKEVLRSAAYHCGSDEVDKVLSYHIKRREWLPVAFLLNGANCNDVLRCAAIEELTKHAAEYVVYDVIHQCPTDRIGTVMSHLITRYMWRAVGLLLARGIGGSAHRMAVGEAVRHSSGYDFNEYILPHCSDDELEQMITHLVSRGQWEAVGGLMKRGVSVTQRRWVVEEASQHASGYHCVRYIMPHCVCEDLEEMLAHLVSRGQWHAVGGALKLGVSGSLHRRAVEKASQCADDDDFAGYLLPHCDNEELEQVMKHLVSRGLWSSVGGVLHRGVSSAQHGWVVEEASQHSGGYDFVRYILPHCTDEDLVQVITHLVSRGLWQAVGEVLDRGVRNTQHKMAVEAASQYANCLDFYFHILCHCVDEELEQVIGHLVRRGLWKAVDGVLKRGVSDTQRTMAVEDGIQHANDDDFAEFVLPHCADGELGQVIARLLSRRLWRVLGEVLLKRGVRGSQHSKVVEEASQRASGYHFVNFILPHCLHEEMPQVMSRLVSRRLWRAVGEALRRGVSPSLHEWAVEQCSLHADDDDFDRFILCHCRADHLVAVLPRFLSNGCYDGGGQVLRGAVCDALFLWATSEQESESQNTLFWTLIRSCVGPPQALGLYKAVTQNTRFSAYDLSGRLNRAHGPNSSGASSSVEGPNNRWHRALCEVLFTSLSHALCYLMCSDDMEYRDSTEEIRKSVNDIYRQLTSCIRDNTNSVGDARLGIIRNQEEWTSAFKELATIHQTDPLFFLHFLQGLNSYRASRRGEDDDIILLTMFAVLPLFPEMQSVALKIMQREKRWDIISQACRSHLWEHDRRWLFKVAVEQSQWSVVKLWADHSLQEDQRFWALEEAYKEKQWEAYLLLTDHGLTETQLMGMHYNVAKYGEWSTVLQMFERGGDVAEVMWKLCISRTEPRRKGRHEIDDATLEYRLRQLQELERGLKAAYHQYPKLVHDRSIWPVLLYRILQGHPEYIIPTMQKAREKGAWHVVMHLVRLGMSDADREKLFPEMVAQQQWGVCRKLLEYGVSLRLCLEFLPQLMEKNQWFLVGLVLKYNVGIDTIRQVMDCAFQRREGTVFWQCLALVENKQLSKERWWMLFHMAISRDIWELIKQLVGRHDSVGRQHRDIAFLEALEQHLWDVVDECQLHGADINEKDDDDETALHKELRNRDWMAVKEIVYHDGDPNLLDKYRYSVLNRLINDEQWETLEFVIKYGANIHFPARLGYKSRDRMEDVQMDRRRYRGKRSPLQGLLDDWQNDSIKFTLMWCPDQWLGVDCYGETALHVACLTEESRKSVHYLLARKVDPLAVSQFGLSPLAYAVLGECPEVMVATCIRFGFSTHQPSLTTIPDTLDTASIIYFLHYFDFPENEKIPMKTIRRSLLTTSPLLLAMLRPQRDDINTRSVIAMLYQSGACCYRELFWLYTSVCGLLERLGEKDWVLQLHRFRHCISPYLVSLKQAACNPRSLKSSCRLTISHCIGLRGPLGHRQLKVSSLALDDNLQNYVLFKDLWYGLCLE